MQKLMFLAIVFLVLSCGTTKEVVYQAPEFDFELLDTMVVSAPVYVEGEDFILPPYNPEASRYYDLLHTKLKLAFDWEKQHVLGQAYLDLAPLFYPIKNIVLDAKQFIIHKVSLGEGGRELAYQYNDFQLNIELDRLYRRDEKIQLYIDYTAQPNEGPQGGSAAITSDKGLFFINPLGTDIQKPRQIWTQGETENNSKWFPTFDKPNERCTQEMYITVEDGLQTLSNGELVSSKKNTDGTRTDYWNMDLPHAPYLFMIAIGTFERIKDSWNGKLLEYMVDPGYESHAKEIFNHTPEMLTFFSDLLDYPYPWNKYSQVIAEDYVSGAMENTTGVIFGDFVQKTKRELIDNENDQIVAHEMFHHWFGDLVTCESWANLTLNEGFANYSEYLWYEHKYGKDAADAIRMNEMDGYFYLASQAGTHPLIHYGYGDKEDMFDAHSYNKGGLVLHMLRNIMGDEAFFAALSKYLKDNEYTAVETAQLRMACEEVMGADLNWFFDQWYLDQGHPELNVLYKYANNAVKIYVEQVQDPEQHRPVFILPFNTAIYDYDGKVTMHSTMVDARKDTIFIDRLVAPPLVASLDGDCTMLGTIDDNRSEEELVALTKHSSYHYDKRVALKQLVGKESLQSLAGQLLDDPHYSIRMIGIANAPKKLVPRVKKMITEDKHSGVRAEALMAYSNVVGIEILPILDDVFNTEQAYPPIELALQILSSYDPKKALKKANELKKDAPSALINALSNIFASSGEAKYLEYIKSNFDKVNVYQVFSLFGNYQELLTKQDSDTMMKEIPDLQKRAINDNNSYRRFMSTSTINGVKEALKIIVAEGEDENASKYLSSIYHILSDIMDKETDEALKERYGAM